MNSKENKTDLIIADNQFLVTESLKLLLSEQFNIIAVAGTVNELNTILNKCSPQLLITDYSTFDYNGLDDLKEIRKNLPQLNIVILSGNITKDELSGFNSVGIKNIIHKNCDREELFACINAALAGKKFYSDIFLDMLFDINERKSNLSETGQLTLSETEIVKLIAQGLTTKEIAMKKFLSFHTVMTHRKNILRKVGVSNASELIMYAIKSGIIDTIEYHI